MDFNIFNYHKKLKKSTPYLIRFGYHKCLTRYMEAIFEKNKHFKTKRYDFIDHIKTRWKPRFVSINNVTINPEMAFFEDALMVHLIRHPKDLIISGYHYHKKGSETWNRMAIPKLKLYKYKLELDHVLNDEERKLLDIPKVSYQDLLEALPFEKGMMLEMVWLKYIKTFNPLIYYQSSRLPTFRFEEIMQNPEEGIRQICQHWQLTDAETTHYCERAKYYNRNPSYPVRDSSAYQYQKVFNKDLNQFFNQQFNQLVSRLDYPD